MKKILILGANGFIGSHLANHFAKKGDYEVFGTIFKNFKNQNGKVKYLFADLADSVEVDELFKRTKPDIVLHAAAYTTGSKDVVEAPWKHVTTNTIINALVLEACNTHKVEHTVFFSCSVPYQSKDTPQKEADWNPGDEIPKAYFGVGNMKVFTERLCEFYSRLGGKFTAIRNSNIYGPWDKTDFDKCHMLPAQIRKVCEATNTLEVWGDGISTKRDVLYVSDVVGLVDAVINNQKKNYELFNCGSGVARSVIDIINAIQKAAAKDLKIIYDTSKPSIPTTLSLDTSKAKELLGWEPRVSFEEGIVKTVKWYQENHK